MPGEDYDDADGPAPSSPPPPDDRLWRHPSEMARWGPPGTSSFPDSLGLAPMGPRRTPWGLLATSSLIGASVAVVAILVTGLGERVIEREIVQPASVLPVVTTSPPAPTSTSLAGGLTEIVDRVIPSLARIEVAGPDGPIYVSAVAIRTDGLLLTDAIVASALGPEAADLTVGAAEPTDGDQIGDAGTAEPTDGDPDGGAGSGPDRDGDQGDPAATAAPAQLQVRLSDGRRLPGVLVAVDHLTGLAVVRVDADDLAVAVLPGPGELRVGEVAVAVGVHDGGGPTLSAGVVSATGLRIRRVDGSTLHGMIQTDAAIPEASIGGALVSAEGRIIGVTHQVGAGTPFGIATPIASALAIADELIEFGRARHPWLGVEGRDGPTGPVVVALVDDGPAALAGLGVDDVILRVDDTEVSSMSELVITLRDHRPGDEVTITYRRAGTDDRCRVTLGERG